MYIIRPLISPKYFVLYFWKTDGAIFKPNGSFLNFRVLKGLAKEHKLLIVSVNPICQNPSFKSKELYRTFYLLT